jgi:hypothetical protein
LDGLNHFMTEVIDSLHLSGLESNLTSLVAALD